MSKDTSGATSSTGTADGPTPSGSPNGLDLFGQPLSPVSRSRRRGSKKRTKTKDISGPCSFGSSESAVLQSFLASRLRQILGDSGSLEYEVTWKRWAMPSGSPICALRGRQRPISDSGFTGWPTPTGQDNDQVLGEYKNPKSGTTLGGAARLAGWISPSASDGNGGKGPRIGVSATGAMPDGSKAQMDLSAFTKVVLAGWASPACRDWKSGDASPETMDRNARPLNEQAVNLTGWATPRSTDGDKNIRSLDGAIKEADRKSGNNDLGTTSMLSHAGTGKPGVLNAAFSLWLQGYPSGWLMVAPAKTSRAKKSSKESGTPSSPR